MNKLPSLFFGMFLLAIGLTLLIFFSQNAEENYILVSQDEDESTVKSAVESFKWILYNPIADH